MTQSLCQAGTEVLPSGRFYDRHYVSASLHLTTFRWSQRYPSAPREGRYGMARIELTGASSGRRLRAIRYVQGKRCADSSFPRAEQACGGSWRFCVTGTTNIVRIRHWAARRQTRSILNGFLPIVSPGWSRVPSGRVVLCAPGRRCSSAASPV